MWMLAKPPEHIRVKSTEDITEMLAVMLAQVIVNPVDANGGLS